jgi:hypothetical protein
MTIMMMMMMTKGVRQILYIACLLQSSLGLLSPPTLSLVNRWKLAKKSIDRDEPVVSEECVQMKSTAGLYTYRSPGRNDVCGLFIVGGANQLVTVDIMQLEIDCEDDGLLVLVDGWEINGELFPSTSDHPVPVEQRYLAFCGQDRPRGVMIMSQNVALIQFRIPRPGQYFTIRVDYQFNPQPCNVISTTSDGVATMTNYGFDRNCSLLFVYPELIQIIHLNVGQVSPSRTKAHPWSAIRTAARLHRCSVDGGDYVEVLGGSGLDTANMVRYIAICGHQTKLGTLSDAVETVRIVYPYTAIRLVSTGRTYNTLALRYQQLTAVQDSLQVDGDA